MILRTGIDIVEVKRIQNYIEERGNVFLNRIYTQDEQAYCEARGLHRYESYAARFAAKEAVAKALGVGISKDASFISIEIICEENGKPVIKLHDEAAAYAKALSISTMDVSLSHTKETAIAIAVLM